MFYHTHKHVIEEAEAIIRRPLPGIRRKRMKITEWSFWRTARKAALAFGWLVAAILFLSILIHFWSNS